MRPHLATPHTRTARGPTRTPSTPRTTARIAGSTSKSHPRPEPYLKRESGAGHSPAAGSPGVLTGGLAGEAGIGHYLILKPRSVGVTAMPARQPPRSCGCVVGGGG